MNLNNSDASQFFAGRQDIPLRQSLYRGLRCRDLC